MGYGECVVVMQGQGIRKSGVLRGVIGVMGGEGKGWGHAEREARMGGCPRALTSDNLCTCRLGWPAPSCALHSLVPL